MTGAQPNLPHSMKKNPGRPPNNRAVGCPIISTAACRLAAQLTGTLALSEEKAAKRVLWSDLFVWLCLLLVR